ncbi:MAG: hypothetical protein KAT83_00320 [Candidatus Aenigmarchaeota archaeon]|nr:hypothetical protein [Candidatus Aenigmarchaeota archaeon]
MSPSIIETELFEIYFSKDKSGKEDRKFKPKEKELILKSIKSAEETISKVISFSRSKPVGEIYRVPIIFEKISKKRFQEKHQNHFAMIDYPPIGMKWNMTLKCTGIEIKSQTAVISLCPLTNKDFIETIVHEVIHAFYDSFTTINGANIKNNTYFIEGLTEWLTQLTMTTSFSSS